MSDPILIYTGSTAEPLTDVIKVNNRPLDLTDAEIQFYMRNEQNSTLIINGVTAEVVDPTAGQIQYEWETSDLSVPGEYKGWWRIVEEATNDYVETSEFPIVILQHAPGVKTKTGAIYRRARSIIPVTWDALENSPKYGDALLQERIEVVKLYVFNDEIPVENEATYDIRVQQYIAKLACLQIIPAGIDYWMDQHQTLSATGVNEMVSYPSRIEALKDTQKMLLGEVKAEQSEIEEILDIPKLRPFIRTPAYSDGIEEGWRTPLPTKAFRDFHFPVQHGAGKW